jgi:hypothetical protein
MILTVLTTLTMLTMPSVRVVMVVMVVNEGIASPPTVGCGGWLRASLWAACVICRTMIFRSGVI